MGDSGKIIEPPLSHERAALGWTRIAHKLGSALSVGYLRHHLRTPLYANAYYLMANTAVNSVLGFLFWTIAARLYPSDEVGVGSALVSAVVLLSTISTLGLGTGLIRFLPGAAEDGTRMLNVSFTAVMLGSLASTGVFLAGLPLWSPALNFVHSSLLLAVFFAVSVLFLAWGGLLNQIFIAHRAARYTFLRSGSMSVSKVLLLLILFRALDGSLGVFAATSIAAAIALVIGAVWFLPAVRKGYKPRPQLSRRILSSLVPYSFGNFAAAFVTQVPQMVLPIMILNLLGAEQSAYAYMVWMVANALFVIPGAISISTFAEGSNEETLLGTHVRRALRLTLLLLVPAIAAILLLGGILLHLFGSAYAEEGTGLLSVLALSALPVGVNSIYFAIKKVRKEIKPLVLLSAFIALSTLLWSYLLMPGSGIVATGIGWLVSQGLVSALVGLSFWRRARAARQVAAAEERTGRPPS